MKKQTGLVGTIAAMALGAGAVMLATDGNGQRTRSEQSVRCGLTENGALTRLENYRGACPADPAGKPQYNWLPAPVVPAPAYDISTQVLEGPAYEVQPTVIVESWNVRAKTQAELDADAASAVGSLSPAAKNPICDLQARVQAVEGVTPVVKTAAECDAWIKSLDTR